jgi:hypothetical protein
MHGNAIAIPFLHALQLHLAARQSEQSGAGLIEPRARSFWNPDEVGPDWPFFHVAPSTEAEDEAIEGAGLADDAHALAKSLVPHLPEGVQAVATPALEALKLLADAHAGLKGSGAGQYGGGWFGHLGDAVKSVGKVAKAVQHNDLVKAIEKKAVGYAKTAGVDAVKGLADGALADTGVGELLAPLANRGIDAAANYGERRLDAAIDGSGYYRPGEGYYRPGEGLRPTAHMHAPSTHVRPFAFRRIA